MKEVQFESSHLGFVAIGKLLPKKKGFEIDIQLGRQHVGYILRIHPSPKVFSFIIFFFSLFYYYYLFSFFFLNFEFITFC